MIVMVLTWSTATLAQQSCTVTEELTIHKLMIKQVPNEPKQYQIVCALDEVTPAQSVTVARGDLVEWVSELDDAVIYLDFNPTGHQTLLFGAGDNRIRLHKGKPTRMRVQDYALSGNHEYMIPGYTMPSPGPKIKVEP
jgi:hypothetical protein